MRGPSKNRHTDVRCLKCPRQESNLVFDRRRVACDPAHSEDSFRFFLSRRASCQLADTVTCDAEFGKLAACPTLSTSPRSRTSSGSFERCPASVTPARQLGLQNHDGISRPGVEPGPGASETPMRSFTPSGHESGLPKQARARGVEPRGAVLEAACSPRSTLVRSPRTAVRGLRKTLNSPASRSSTPR